jgi:hypothetical protein
MLSYSCAQLRIGLADKYGEAEVPPILLSPDLCFEEREAAFIAACRHGKGEILKLPGIKGCVNRVWSLAWRAAAGGDAKTGPTGDIRLPIPNNVLDVLLEAAPAQPAGVDQAIDQNMKTALIASAQGGHLLAVKRLIESEATIDATTSNGMTALWSAAGNGHDDCIEVLLGAGACVDTLVDNISVLYIAAQNGHADVVERLLVAGAKPQGSGEAKPLTAACNNGGCDIPCTLHIHIEI